MLNCAEQVKIQKYKTHAYKTPKTACVQSVMLKHPTKQLKIVSNHFVGLVLKASALRAEDPGFESGLRRFFLFRVEPYQ